MNNPNNPRQQDDLQKKQPGGKPMGDQMGQKARPKDGKDDLSDGMDKNKSNDMNKGGKPNQPQH